MAKGPGDLSIVRIPNATKVQSDVFDAYCLDWIADDKARQARYRSRWTWMSLPWQMVLFDPDYNVAAALNPNRELEGLIAVKASTVKPSTAGKRTPLLVDYCQTAPRNYDVPPTHAGLDGRPGERRGVGTALLRWAVEESQRLGAGGAFTLASLKEAEPFYDGLNLAPAGRTANGRKIYILAPQDVANFLDATKLRAAGRP